MAIYALTIKHKAKGNGASASAHADYLAREGKYKYLQEEKAMNHAEYLTREGSHKRRVDELEKTWSGNIPNWAESPKDFWKAADLYERANGRVYTEVVMAIPRELSKEGREKVVQDFINREIGERFAYTVALHNPKALDGGQQPHAHIMFSTRELDGIERSRDLFFKRANPEHPELGGAKKTREWSFDDRSNDRVNDIRVSWEVLANKALEREGREERIDRRTLAAQGIDREPEPKMGPEVTQKLKRGEETEVGSKVIQLREYKRQEREVKDLEKDIEKQRGLVLQFGERREGKEQEDLFSFEKGRQGPEVSEEDKKRYQRTLDLVLEKKEGEGGVTKYHWKRSGRVAFTDYGDKIVFSNTSETAIKAGLQLAKQKGWETTQLFGSEEFRRESWLQGEIMGIKTKGFAPEAADFSLLEERRKAEELKKSQYRKKDDPAREKEPIKEDPKEKPKSDSRTDSNSKEYSAADLEKDLRREAIPALEAKTKALNRNLREMGFQGSPEDPLIWQYKVVKGWQDLPTDEDLRGKAFDHLGGAYYKDLKNQYGKASEEIAKNEEALSKMAERDQGSILKKLSPARLLEKKRLTTGLKRAQKLAGESKRSIGDEQLRLSTGKNKELFDRTVTGYAEDRQSTQEKRDSLLNEYWSAARDLKDAYSLRMNLKELGQTKVRAVVKPGKLPQVDSKEIQQKLREQEQARKKDKSLGLRHRR